MNADVIVIGAGVAGLSAAGELGRKGLRVIVLEARERAGGRLYSVPLPDGLPPVELGAEFVHGGNPQIRAILKKARIKTQPADANMWWRLPAGLTLIPDFWSRIAHGIRGVPGKNCGWSLAEFLRRKGYRLLPEDRWLLENYAPGFNAAPLNKLSAPALRADHAGADNTDLKVKGRYDSVVKQLRTRLAGAAVSLKFRNVVTTVHWQRGRVSVVTRDHTGQMTTYEAKAAIVTLPLGILQSGRVTFSPGLGRKQAVIDRLGWGYAVRLTLRFRRDFWSRTLVPALLRAKKGRAFGFVNAPGEAFPVWWALSSPAPLLTAWAGGDAALRLDNLTPSEKLHEAIRSLAHILGTTQTALRAQLLGSWSHDWHGDPYTLGAYSYAKAGEEKGPRELARPLAKTLFFAGEATAEDLGTVHGAIASGLRAAGEVGFSVRNKRHAGLRREL